jgi:O-antigen ligase
MRAHPWHPAGDRSAEAACVLLLVAALLFGGGPRGAGDLVVHLAALPALVLAAMRMPAHAASRGQRAFLVWWLLAIGLVLVQLVPLPPGLWSALGPRADVAADLQAAGTGTQWRPMTLDRWATARTLLALLVCAAAWALATTLTPQARRRLLLWALATGAGLALLGFAQAAAGPHTSLRFHGFHHPIGAIGTFANRNHFAALMAMLAPLSFAFGWQAQQQRRLPVAFAMHALGVVLLLAAALSFSRAGTALAALAFAATLVLLARNARGARRWLTPLAVLAAVVLATLVYAWDGLMRRLAQDPADDLRWQYLRHGLDAAREYLPWGSGLGSFKFAYAPFEPVHAMAATFAGHAHNDLLQVLVEAGAPGLIVLVTFLALLVKTASRNIPIGPKAPTREDALASVVTIAIWVPLVHSLVDYPLRTLGIGVVMALLLSCRANTIEAPAAGAAFKAG